MSKSLFVKKTDTDRIELEGENWVDVPKRLSGKAVFSVLNADKDDTQAAINMLEKTIVDWSLVEEDKTKAEITKENILRLPIEIINLLSEKLMEKFAPDKKKLSEQSKKSEEEKEELK